MRGLTGLVKFQTDGFRGDFELDIVHLKSDGLKKVGSYNSTSGVEWRVDTSSTAFSDDDDIQNKTFKILIALVSGKLKINS